MSSLSQRDRRELVALRRSVEHSHRQHAANLARAFRRLRPDLDAAAEKMLDLRPGTIACRRHGDELADTIARILDAIELDQRERRNGSEP
jgi:hypothetical protein